jgi:hypothetical protein
MECSKTGKMKVRNCAEILHREVRVGCLGLALMTCVLCSWPWAPPLETCCAHGLGFKAIPRLCLGELRAALVASGSALGDLLHFCPRALTPCLGFALVNRVQGMVRGWLMKVWRGATTNLQTFGGGQQMFGGWSMKVWRGVTTTLQTFGGKRRTSYGP